VKILNAILKSVPGLLGAILLAAVPAFAKKPAPNPSTCRLGNGIQHVVYVQFDNTHFLRDNPNVPSDLEQMPNLLNFLKQNGTLGVNHHAVLISHTANDIVTSITGVYSDRNGAAVSNSFGVYTGSPLGSVMPTSTIWWRRSMPPRSANTKMMRRGSIFTAIRPRRIYDPASPDPLARGLEQAMAGLTIPDP
jgi:hypothetical protein